MSDDARQLIVLNNDTVVCEDCYDPPELEVDPGRVPFDRIAYGSCSACGRSVLSPAAVRALAHITGRTGTGRFACRLWDMSRAEWSGALEELREAGQNIRWVYGTVADEPTVTGGWRLPGG